MAMSSPSSSGRRVVAGGSLKLPAGFRFHPTDEELIVHYLMKQAASTPCPVPIIAEVNIYQCNPWDLPAKALFGESEWYFFSPRDRKYPNGARPNRAAGSGYWKATGTDKPILSSTPPTGPAAHVVVGVKKALVFYAGRPSRGVKTDWIMHEYRLADKTATAAKRSRGSSSMRLDDWVLCRIHKKSNDFQVSSSSEQAEQEQEGSSTVEQESPKPETVDNDTFQFYQTMSKSCSLTDLLNSIDCSELSQILDDGALPPPDVGGQEALPLPLPQLNPPLIYPTTTTETHQALNNNNNNNNNMNMNMNMNKSHLNLPHAGAACSDYVVPNNYENSVNKRKRMMAPAGMFDDGSSGGFGTKLKVVLPSDSRNSSSSHFGSTSTSSGSYCNQRVVDTSGSLFQYTNSSSLLMSYPFPEMQ